jgi:predicted nuclease of predicted toxin-antitoxin system
MNFLLDAQLPRRMTAWLGAAGCNAIHTLDLPDANRTTDEQINDVADREQRVVITKDADFVDSHLLRRRPPKLLLISTGNISNRDLEALIGPRWNTCSARCWITSRNRRARSPRRRVD